MLRICEGCEVEFEGAPQARFHSDACRKAHARKEMVEVEAAATADEEQALRDFWGYAKSETRTKTERDATAQRILAAGVVRL